MKKWNPVQLAIFKNQRDKFNRQYAKIYRQAKGYFCKHGMDIGMPENKPAPQGLADIDRQDQQGGTVTDKTDQYSIIDDVFKFILADHVS